MNRKTTLVLAILVLIGATSLIAFQLGKSSSAPASSGDVATTGDHSTTTATESPATVEPAAPKTRREQRDPELIDRYGEARTNLSRHVTSNVVSLLEDAIAMGDMMLNSENGNRFGRNNEWVLRNSLREAGIELDDEQQARANGLFTEFQKRELERSREAVKTLKEEPTTLMSLILASDARAREEISEEEYSALQQQTASELDGVINPLDRNNFRPRDPMDDEVFRTEFSAILDGDQTESFNASLAQREEAAGNPTTDISNIPVMELESLDTAIGSAKQMTAGFKQVMEGMGNLGPILEQQRQGGSGE